MEANRIYNEDCLEGMKRIPDKSIDCIICDLPYGTTANKWDSAIPLDDLWQEYVRVIKDNGAVLLFGQRLFAAELINSNKKMFRYDWIWKKSRAGGFLDASRMPLRAHEMILCFYKKLPTFNPQFKEGKPYKKCGRGVRPNYHPVESKDTFNDGRRYPTDILDFKHDKISYHPTQKPVALIEYLILTYTNKGDTVLDNCMGSGTTAIACINTGRRYIGFEIDEKYYSIAMHRIENNLVKRL